MAKQKHEYQTIITKRRREERRYASVTERRFVPDRKTIFPVLTCLDLSRSESYVKLQIVLKMIEKVDAHNCSRKESRQQQESSRLRQQEISAPCPPPSAFWPQIAQNVAVMGPSAEAAKRSPAKAASATS